MNVSDHSASYWVCGCMFASKCTIGYVKPHPRGRLTHNRLGAPPDDVAEGDQMTGRAISRAWAWHGRQAWWSRTTKINSPQIL